MQEEVRLNIDHGSSDYSPSYAASFAALLQQKDLAFQQLERACDSRAGILFLKVEPMFDGLRSDSRYADPLRRMDLPQSQ